MLFTTKYRKLKKEYDELKEMYDKAVAYNDFYMKHINKTNKLLRDSLMTNQKLVKGLEEKEKK